MKKELLTLIIFCCSLTSTHSQSGWVLQNVGNNNYFSDIFFINPNTGFAAGDTLKKTTNGGINWTPISRTGVKSVFFFNSDTGFIGDNTGGNIRGVSKTTDGGLTWVTTNFSNPYASSICFVNQMTGWLATGIQGGGDIYKTTNSGNNWFSVFQGYGQLRVQFIDTSYGYAVSWYANLSKTTDGGLNWTNTPPGGYCYCVFLVDTNTVYAGGNNGLIYKTTNGGNNWSAQSTGIPAYFFSIFFTSPVTGYAVGQRNPFGQIIMKTTNAGENWLTQTGVTTHALFHVFFINSSTGWAAGDSGTILKTTDGGGLVGIEPSGHQIPAEFHLYQNFPNPFNPTAKIKFDIPRASNVQLIIYDILGKEIIKLVDENLNPGDYSVDWNGNDFPSGIYIYKLQTNEFSETKRMVLIK